MLVDLLVQVTERSFRYTPAPKAYAPTRHTAAELLEAITALDDGNFLVGPEEEIIGPEEELDELKQAVLRERKQRLRRHLASPEAVEHFRLIYSALISHENTLCEDRKQMIRLKIIEAVLNCTTGLINRLRAISDGFDRAQSLDELLCSHRLQLVGEAATRYGDGWVHADNRYRVVANASGFGTRASDDSNSGNYRDAAILVQLKTYFREHYTPSAIIRDLLNKQLSALGYKKNGSVLRDTQIDAIADFLDILNQNHGSRLFQSLTDSESNVVRIDRAAYFILNDKYEYVGINTARLQSDLLHYFKAEGYFVEQNLTHLPAVTKRVEIEKEKTQEEFTVELRLDRNNYKSSELRIICEGVFDYHIYLGNVPQLITDLTIEGCHASNIQARVLREGLNAVMPQLLESLSLPEIIKAGILTLDACEAGGWWYELDAGVKQFYLAHVDSNGNNALMLAALDHPEIVAPILGAMSGLPDEAIQIIINQVNTERENLQDILWRKSRVMYWSYINAVLSSGNIATIKAILLQTDSSDFNALMAAAFSHPQMVAPILLAMSEFSPDERNAVFTQVSTSGRNALILAARYHPEVVAPILRSMLQLPDETVQTIINQVDTENHNLQDVLWRENSNMYWSYINAVLDSDNIAAKKALLLQTNSSGSNVLMRAARHCPEMMPSILEAMNELRPEDRRVILTQVNSDRYNALMVAAGYQPETMPFILEAMSELRPEDRRAILTQVGDCRYNVLLLVARKAPEIVQPILAAIGRLETEDRKAILTQVDSYYHDNALMKAALNSPETVPSILQAISQLPDVAIQRIANQVSRFGENLQVILWQESHEKYWSYIKAVLNSDSMGIQKAVLLQVGSGGMSALQLAVRYQPEMVAPILQAMNVLMPEDQKAMLTHINRSGSNALMLAAQHQPDMVAPILQAMNVLMPEERKAMLTHVNSTGWNVLMLAERGAVAPILAQISRLEAEDRKVILTQVDSYHRYNALMLCAHCMPDELMPVLDLYWRDGLDVFPALKYLQHKSSAIVTQFVASLKQIITDGLELITEAEIIGAYRDEVWFTYTKSFFNKQSAGWSKEVRLEALANRVAKTGVSAPLKALIKLARIVLERSARQHREALPDRERLRRPYASCYSSRSARPTSRSRPRLARSLAGRSRCS